MLREARGTAKVGYGAQGQDEMVISDVTFLRCAGVEYSYNLVFQVDRFNISDSYACTSKHFAKRLYNIVHRQVRAGDLVKHGREEHKVLFSHKRNLDIRRIAELPFEM